VLAPKQTALELRLPVGNANHQPCSPRPERSLNRRVRDGLQRGSLVRPYACLRVGDRPVAKVLSRDEGLDVLAGNAPARCGVPNNEALVVASNGTEPHVGSRLGQLNRTGLVDDALEGQCATTDEHPGVYSDGFPRESLD